MSSKVLMVQGTGSNVGKSILVAALCRIMRQDGWDVAPFKAQNMSLNSFVTRDGGEMGRAQVVQAEAACIEPTVDMNPILLKPEADNRSQIVVRGKPIKTQSAREYYSLKPQLWKIVCESLDKLRAEHELVIIEGAGSPAEINLRSNDIVNMAVALYAHSPVLLVADIDRGGVFASLVGTLEIIRPEERALVKAMIINKFRGDLSLLTSGLEWLTNRTGIPVAGVVPYYHDVQIAEEDSVALEWKTHSQTKSSSLLDIAVIQFPHMSNYDDFDPLEQENDVRLRYVPSRDELGKPDMIILPGTKNTVGDLQFIRHSGLAEDIAAFSAQGKPVIGICGGYQMLGTSIRDPQHVESSNENVRGLGLLPIATTFLPVKATHQVKGHVRSSVGILRNSSGLSITGYEIHMGQTAIEAANAPFIIEERARTACQDVDGCLSQNGMIFGTYVHGLFHNHDLRRSILYNLAEKKGVTLHLDTNVWSKEEHYDKLADLVRKNLDMNLINRIINTENT